jgi:hypothetical protein
MLAFIKSLRGSDRMRQCIETARWYMPGRSRFILENGYFAGVKMWEWQAAGDRRGQWLRYGIRSGAGMPEGPYPTYCKQRCCNLCEIK